jgi:hypothetical protein
VLNMPPMTTVHQQGNHNVISVVALLLENDSFVFTKSSMMIQRVVAACEAVSMSPWRTPMHECCW